MPLSWGRLSYQGNTIMTPMRYVVFGMLSLCVVTATALAETERNRNLEPLPDAAAGHRRTAQLADFLKLQEFGLVRPSPDGRLLAVEIRRPRDAERRITGTESVPTRSDLWIVDVVSGAAEQITHGTADGTWYWSPLWAPDSQRLALLVGQPGGQVRLALWERRRKALRVLTDAHVNLEANFGALGRNSPDGRVAAAWIDETRLLTVFVPEGTDSWFTEYTDVRRLTASHWKQTEEGRTAVTVWDNRHIPVCGRDSTLVLLDIERRRTVSLLKGAIKAVSVSPDGRFAAVTVATASRALNPDEPTEVPLEWNAYTHDAHVETALTIVDLAQHKDLGVVAGVDNLTFLSRTRAPRWSQDSGHLVVPVHSPTGEDTVHWVDVPERNRVSFEAASPLDAEVLADLLVSAKTLSHARVAAQSRERFSGEPLRWGMVPGDVVRLTRRRLGVVLDGQMTILDASGRIESRADAPRGRLIYPRPGNVDETHWLLFDAGKELQRVETDPATARLKAIPKPSTEARLVAVGGRHEHLVFIADRDDGSYLWITSADGGKQQVIFSLNQHLRAVAPPRKQLIHYRLPNGQPRTGLLLLPPDYVAGQRYPAILTAYPSVVITEEYLSRPTLNDFYEYARTLLASAGYVVLYPVFPSRLPEHRLRFQPWLHRTCCRPRMSSWSKGLPIRRDSASMATPTAVLQPWHWRPRAIVSTRSWHPLRTAI